MREDNTYKNYEKNSLKLGTIELYSVVSLLLLYADIFWQRPRKER